MMEGKGLNNVEVLIPLASEIRASGLTTVPVIGDLTGNEEYKGDKIYCQ